MRYAWKLYNIIYREIDEICNIKYVNNIYVPKFILITYI